MAAYEYYPIEKYDALCAAVVAVNQYLQNESEVTGSIVHTHIDEFADNYVEVIIELPLPSQLTPEIELQCCNLRGYIQRVVVRSFIDGFIAAYNTNHHPEESNESPTA